MSFECLLFPECLRRSFQFGGGLFYSCAYAILAWLISADLLVKSQQVLGKHGIKALGGSGRKLITAFES